MAGVERQRQEDKRAIDQKRESSVKQLDYDPKNALKKIIRS